jgi:DinB superfamily
MDTKDVIKSQYYASLEMLGGAISKCPTSLWNSEEFKNKFWHIAYHVLFYTHLYLQETEKQFVPWKKHREHHQFLGNLPWLPHTKPDIGESYSKEEILEYLDMCKKEVEEKVSALDLTSESGFYWLPFKKLELQFYNIRHIQHHTGALIDRLRTKENIGVDWVAMKTISPD